MSNHNWFGAGFAIWVLFQGYDDIVLWAGLELPQLLPDKEL